MSPDITGIYLDKAPEDGNRSHTGYVIYYRGEGRHGPYRVAPFAQCTMPHIERLADDCRGWEGETGGHRVFVINEMEGGSK